MTILTKAEREAIRAIVTDLVKRWGRHAGGGTVSFGATADLLDTLDAQEEAIEALRDALKDVQKWLMFNHSIERPENWNEQFVKANNRTVAALAACSAEAAAKAGKVRPRRTRRSRRL